MVKSYRAAGLNQLGPVCSKSNSGNGLWYKWAKPTRGFIKLHDIRDRAQTSSRNRKVKVTLAEHA